MPTCNTCTSPTPISYEIQYFHSDQCAPCSSSTGCDCTYQGANLTCSGIVTGDTLEQAFIKIDSQICNATGDYSSYQYNCLTPVSTEAEFVDMITDYVCTMNTALGAFTNSAYITYQTSVDTRFDAIEVPGITCASASVTNTDTLQQVLTKYCTKFASLTTAISLSGITWNNCFTVGSTPTTIAASFTEVLSQICQTKALIASSTLPTFNNSSNCLAGTSNDTLVTTIGLLTTKVCAAATVAIGSLTTSCLTLGSTLQSALQAVISKVDTLTQNDITFSGDFVVTATDGGDPCAGRTVALATPINADRFVASNASDSSPGTLISKLQAGTSISLDDTTTPGKVIINSTGVDRKVSAATADASPGFLVDKLEGSSINGITITPVYNSGTGKVTLQLSVDEGFCTAVQACTPSFCLTYSVENPTGATINLEYTPCGSTLSTVVGVTASSTIELCAVQYSLIPATDTLIITATTTCS